jgi:hypothetical protein
MLRGVNFWREESEAPLLRLNHSFLPSTEIVKQINENNQDDLIPNFNHERIIRLDAERTILGVAQRTTLMNVLSFLRNEFDSYHQAMSYVAGFLLLTHSPCKVIETMRQLHRNDPQFTNTYPKITFFRKPMHRNGSPPYALVFYRSRRCFCSSIHFLLNPCLHHRIFSYSNSR